MEGGFSKAFLMKRANGTDVIAKIPCRIAGPPSLTTAGEVAVLEYVKRHTSIPVPRVLSWSSDGSNNVGAEYIIMDKAPGVPLFQVWGTMTEFERLQLIKNLTKLEAQLATIKFPVGTSEQQRQPLEVTTAAMKLLDSNELLKKACQPTLWHTDLHMENIFVNPDECSTIVSLIDFQSTSVLPAFLQAQWPIFLRPPQNYDYERGIFQPQLPEDFDRLDEENGTIALREWSQVKLAKAYEVSTYLEDRAAHDAMSVPQICQNWASLGFSGECSYSFSQAELDEHERQFAEYQAWDEVRMLAEECFDTDSEGWIAPQLDINEKRRQNKELMALYIEKVAGERSEKEAKGMWPFSTET
ncbi:uncharacterized protein N7496_008091 [Penicillium cataractarum]|uniref:Altered inheritance of mitochondria protein 9, mitochondrial n=1 Tax=Penicillium cataractarum TaxID=2100454 RepID=A0A9W9RY40_9EURO|nr:uncharacterized protein N7496_008091 [Penicillium cataractarum]KAJ5368331.1 hypothetical protein N7496_008091 [Penicillium cataractarum]